MTHGHQDAGAVSFFAAGRQILWQPGLYGYTGGAMRRYVRSNEAHNVVDIPGATYDTGVASSLTASKSASAYDLVSVRSTALPGATWKRTMVHLKGPHVLLVDDQVTQAQSRTVSQNWQFGSDRSVSTGVNRANTSGPGSDATVLFVGAPSLKVVKGATNPMLGWRSERTNAYVKAPTLVASKKGTSVRLTTIVVPRTTETADTVKVLRWATTSKSRTVDFSVGTAKYRVVFSATSATVTRF